MKRVLFVCLGNICRSPMAEGLFIHLVKQQRLVDQFEIDSCGTGGWHQGELADERMRETAQKHGLQLISRARKLIPSDLHHFDYILAMDRSNLRDIQQMKRQHGGTAEVFLMREFDPKGQAEDVPDPYYGGKKGFDKVYEMLERSAENLLAYIQDQV